MSQEIDNRGNSSPALIWEYYKDKNVQGRLFNSKEILQRIGEPLFAAFMACFNGINRVLVLEDMIELNEKNYKTDSITFKVNRDVLLRLISGTLYELKEVLQKLCKCKVVEKIKDTT